jgi:hypothetical protein
MRPGSDRWEAGVQFETPTCDPADGVGQVGPIGDPAEQTITLAGDPTEGFWEIGVDGTYGQQGIPAAAASTEAVQMHIRSLGLDVVVTGTSPAFVVRFRTGKAKVLTVRAVIGHPFDTGSVGIEVTSDTAVGLPKNLDSNLGELGVATPLTVYGHFECSPVGWTPAAAQDRATAHLLAREEARVEQAFWTGDLGNTPCLQDLYTEVVMPTAGVSKYGLGELEDYIATYYGSLGIIHMTRGTAQALLSDFALVSKGSQLYTMLGTPVAAGAGYPGTGPNGEAAVTGTGWIYGSPAVFGYRSEVFTSSSIPGDLLDRANNNLYSVAERTYLLGFDPCGVGAALIDLP